jgi:hypothetical protein
MSGFDSEGHRGRPEAGSRFSQYSLLALGVKTGIINPLKDPYL